MATSSVSTLAGQKALVTGGSSGIGAGVARALAAAGAGVGVNYAAAADKAEAVVAKIRDARGEAIALKADVSREGDVLQMFERFHETFGRIDILVANAGLQRDASISTLGIEDWNKVIEVNLTGQFLCIREAIKRFLAQGQAPNSKAIGKIVCMSSVHEIIPWAGHVNYAASKGGVSLMMKSVAQEVAKHKIRVNSVAPGAIRTDINRSAWSTPEALRKLLELIPYGRIGEPEDVANAVVWLCSDESDYVTGTTLFIDGGMTLYPGFIDNG
jgi:glucose 1-dehydrogenase